MTDKQAYSLPDGGFVKVSAFLNQNTVRCYRSDGALLDTMLILLCPGEALPTGADLSILRQFAGYCR